MTTIAIGAELEAALGSTDPGTSRWRVEYAKSADGASQSFPLIRIAGANLGPTAVFVAGVHGDEYEGPGALWDLAEKLDPTLLSGQVLIVPIANVLAFAAGTRTSPIDNENLARIFPGNSTGTLSHRLAAALMEGVVSRADFLVDSHSGGVRLAFAPVAGFYDDPSIDPKVAEQSIALAKSMGIAYLWQLPPVTGVLSYEAARRGIPVCGAEIGGRGNCLDADRADYLAAYLSVLAHHGMIAPEHKRLLTTICFEGDWARSAASGYLQTTVTIGDKVNAEAIVGRLLDPLGDIVEELRASHAGTVLGVRHLNTVQPGDLTICIARETIR